MELVTAIGLTAFATALIVATGTCLAVKLMSQGRQHASEQRVNALQLENVSLGERISAWEARVTDLE